MLMHLIQGVDSDLDAASIFMLDDDGKCPTDKEFIFLQNLATQER